MRLVDADLLKNVICGKSYPIVVQDETGKSFAKFGMCEDEVLDLISSAPTVMTVNMDLLNALEEGTMTSCEFAFDRRKGVRKNDN